MGEHFSLEATHSTGARLGVLHTSHGDVRTPFFMPIATKGSVKTLHSSELWDIEQQADKTTTPIVLSNTYHLYLRPGEDTLKQLGGLHGMMDWNGAMLTDSGGFQVFSLSHLRKLTDDGVEFRSHIDGSSHMMTPERSMEIQSAIGSDIWMAFDYFPGYPASKEETERSVALTTAWARRCRDFHQEFLKSAQYPQKLFGIVQGSTHPELREQSAKELQEIGFDGYAVGGLAVGEPPEVMYDVLDSTVPHLPEDSPRYLMGVGPPEQILEAVKKGIDMFDCVIPTRNARHGSVFIRTAEKLVDSGLSEVAYEKLNVKAAKSALSQETLDPYCACPTCSKGITRAYIRHLFTVEEPLAERLTTVHNIYFYMQLMADIRTVIEQETI